MEKLFDPTKPGSIPELKHAVRRAIEKIGEKVCKIVIAPKG